MIERKQSFLERLTGTKTVFDDEISPSNRRQVEQTDSPSAKPWSSAVYHEEYADTDDEHEVAQNEEEDDELTDDSESEEEAAEEESEEEEETEIPGLAIDMYESDNELVIQCMIAGVTPENLHIDVTRSIVTIDGTRIAPEGIPEEHYVNKELYWGQFKRTITLPFEIDPEGAEAVEKYGLLIIRLPRLDKSRSQKLKVRSI